MSNIAEPIKQDNPAQQDILSVLNEILIQIKRNNIAGDDALWTDEDIANYLRG